MFIIFLIFLTTVFANSHEKYIDLLPEEEKQDFLDHVARRIMENVESKEDTVKYSRELSDDQLKEHNDFVQSILKQESLQMRRNKGEEHNDEDNKSAETLSVKPLISSAENNEFKINNVGHADLNIKDIKRRTFDDSFNASAIDVTKIDVTTDVQGIQKRSVTEGQVSEETKNQVEKQEELTTDKDVSAEKTNHTDSTTLAPGEYNGTTATPDVVLSKESDTDVSFENVVPIITTTTSTTEKASTTTDSIISSTTTDTAPITTTVKTEVVTKKQANKTERNFTDSSIFYIKQEKIELTTVEPVTTSKASESSESSESDEDYTPTGFNDDQKGDNSTLTSTLSDEGTTEEVTETTYTESTESNPETSTLSSSESNVSDVPGLNVSISSNDNNTADSSAENVTENSNTTKKFRAVEQNNTKDVTTEKTQIETLITVETTTLPAVTTVSIPVLTPTNIEEQTTKKPKRVKSKDNSTSSHAASNSLKRLKDKYKKKKLESENEFQHFKEVQNNFTLKMFGNSECTFPSCDSYRVYEVHWPVSAEDKPFLRASEPMIDQPSFVPIYNYSPNKAYYNPENRLGPNLVEKNSIEIDSAVLRLGKDNTYVPERPEFIIDLDLDLMRKFGYYTKKDKEYHIATLPTTKWPPKKKKKRTTTTTEAPSEESTERTINFPNSDEDSHPYNAMKGSMKNQIRIIRNVLFHNKHFVDPQDDNQRDYERFLYGEKKKIKKKLKKLRSLRTALRTRHKKARDISLDYYYGRTKKKDKKEGKVLRSFDDVKYFFINLFKSKPPPRHTPVKQESDEETNHKYKNKYQMRKVRKDKSKNKTHDDKFNTIAKILDITPANDMLINLEKMQGMNFTLMRRNTETKFSQYMSLLKDMIIRDDKALKQYDWLSTTVQIQSALSKLFELIDLIRESRPVHPADVQILKYTMFLHNFASEVRKASSLGSYLRRQLMMPRNSKDRSNNMKEKGLINRVWLYLRTLLPDLKAENDLVKLNNFLVDLETGLFGLHDAMKNIARITKFKNQHWYENLKDLYLSPDDKQVNEVLLHLTTARLVDLLEYSCQNGLEDDFVEFMKKNKDLAKRTMEEMMFVLKILQNIGNSNM